MQIVVISILAGIALIDARTHRIPNRGVLILAIASVATIDYGDYVLINHLRTFAVVLSASVFLSICCGLGMGDVKLLGVLAMFVLPPEPGAYKVFLLTVALTASVHTIFLSRGDIRKSVDIPLAPAILLGTIIALVAK